MADFIGLGDFVPALSPRYSTPLHLQPLVGVFERIARGEQVRVVVNVPPRFGKTELLLHGCAWLLAQRPELQIMFSSYSGRLAEKKSRKARELARKAGVPLSADSTSRADWRTGVDDGGMWANGIEGSMTGEGAHVLICDDLIKGRAEAESGTIRERARDWFLSDALTRLEPDGSVIVNGTRWHPEDPSAVAIGLGWEHVNLQAITPEGASLWPERWPLERLIEIRETLGGIGGYEWESLYCGNPRGRGSRVFGDVVFYDELPAAMAKAIGVDFAYSTKSTSDRSVAVLAGHAGGKTYVLDVIAVREEPKDFRARIGALVDRHPGVSLSAYISGTERGIVAFFQDGGLPINAVPASSDKFTRAVAAAAAWNTGRILLPRGAPWLDTFVSEVCGFTGIKDRHDDHVDALVAAFDACAGGAKQIDISDWISTNRGGHGGSPQWRATRR